MSDIMNLFSAAFTNMKTGNVKFVCAFCGNLDIDS